MNSCFHCFGIATAVIVATAASDRSHAQIGNVIGQFSTPGSINPVGLGVDPAGNLWLTATDGTVFQLTATGTVISQWSAAATSRTPNGIAGNGANIFVSDANVNTGGPDLDVYTPQGAYVRSFPLTGVRFPTGVVWRAATNTLFVSDRLTGLVSEFDLQGNAIGQVSLQGVLNDGLAFDPVNNEFWSYQAGGDLCDRYDGQFFPLNSFPGTNAAIGAPGRGAAFLGGVLYVVAQQARAVVAFDTTGTSAGVIEYGAGCPFPGIFYEQFLGTGTGDLANSGMVFASNGRGWTAIRGGTFETNLGPNLNLGDDTILRNQPLGFTWRIPGSPAGSTTAIDIASNGWIGLVPGKVVDTGFAVLESGAEFVKYERIAGWWDDLDPSAAGSVHYTTLSNPTRAVVTWNQVPQFGFNDVNTFQIQLFPNGDFRMYWQTGCLDDALVGFSSGNNVADPGSIDLTATLPTIFGPYGVPLHLTSNRPVLGRTIVYQLNNLPTGASLGAVLFGSMQQSTPLDAIGMTDCTLWTTAELAAGRVNLQTGQFLLPIPNMASLIGVQLTHQGVVFANGINPLGVIASNGLELRLGT